MSTVTKTKTEIDPELLAEAEEKGQIIVHCLLDYHRRCRIWRSTFLIDAETGKRAKLLHAENITFYPDWKDFSNDNPCFTLIFESLPKSCKRFHLHEIIPEPNGWLVKNISRNRKDIYHVVI